MLLREWPLAVFTVLGQTAAGVFLVAVLPLYLFPGRSGETATRNTRLLLLIVVAAVLAAAAAVSFFHLGRPFRAVNALNNIRSSWLSREILSELVFLGGLGILAGLELRGYGGAPAARAVAGFAAVAGTLFLFSMIRLYMLPTVPAWNSPYTPLSFVLTAALTGTLAAHFIRPDPRWLAAALVFFAAAAATAVLYAPGAGLLGWRETPSLRPPSPAFQPVFFLRIALLGLGGLAVSLSLLFQKIPWSGRLIPAALALAIMAETMGRLLFYSAVGPYSR
ncbi:MAG: DmsC/YnfH family molybdoenzyme membrane anchor subunit [Acidobacteriota bacterium]|nr:DmsC/YnfH family molybdoenzyme membrane anchor subunit [Acidobacteriota bacterium]